MLDAIVIGAGMSGILAAIKLKQAGFNDLVILEKSTAAGGTWWDNRYPGCACDVPSHFYSYSFEPNPHWTRIFPQQPEILAYFQGVAQKYGLMPHMRFSTEVSRARFDEARGCWQVTTAAGEVLEGRTLIFGTGQLSRPLIPQFEGSDTFKGKVFHSARWDHAYDLAGKRVAVIGTGPTAAQFVPEIVDKVARLVVFQRTPNWFFPRRDRPYSPLERGLFRQVPGALRLHRWWIYLNLEFRFLGFKQDSWMAKLMTRLLLKHLKEEVPDEALRAKLTPDYPVGCKRIIIADDYLPAMQRPNVVLDTSGIARITEDAVIDKDGNRHEVDCIIYGTGFEATEFLVPIEVEGLAGQSLHQAWQGGAEAYQGVTVAGFPNMFLLYGPNTNLGHNSIIFMVENQVEHMMALIRTLRTRGLRFIDVRRDVMARYNAWLQEALRHSVWTAGCRNWYMTAEGKVTQNWPFSTLAWWRRLHHTRLEDFNLVGKA